MRLHYKLERSFATGNFRLKMIRLFLLQKLTLLIKTDSVIGKLEFDSGLCQIYDLKLDDYLLSSNSL